MNSQSVSVGGDLNNSGVFNTGKIHGPVVVGNDNAVNANAVEKIAEIIANLQKAAKVLPETQKDDVESDLEDLQAELEQPFEEQQPKKVKRYLRGLVAAVAAVLAGIVGVSDKIKTISINVVDIAGNARTISEEVRRIQGNPTEFKALSPSDWEIIETVSVFSDGISQISEIYNLPDTNPK